MQVIDRGRAHLHTVPPPGAQPPAPRLLSTPILSSRYESDTRALWMYAHPIGRPCFTPELLADVVAQQHEVELAQGTVDFFLNCSSVPGVYNLGGDLDLFRKLVETRDDQALMRYAEACIRAINNNVAGLHADAVSMAVVQGDALGGGFEAALSCHVVIAERGAKLGFPEMMFNLFPGMGAYSLVARKAGPRIAEDLILNARVLPAEKMHELGLVDHLAEPGRGEWVARQVMQSMSSQLKGFRAFQRAKMHAYVRLTYQELEDVTREWVRGAMKLDRRDLRTMERLVKAQNRLHAGHACSDTVSA
ncbi:MAG: enoyl-CoA hydratase/isomerase family protein [Gammaproteobacteria bacterium]|jgi:DSF synthase|nr:enoyl-CoA hydratase/isomerase family protein [Gammaproteobacteria bacterium]MBU0773510.1 enoyl-CoA hydratase/isomerase family protein [Gammaproteobacteria bacterium]MBU0857727.1 enoyl-CoA hydratase/isomerase family protein [Gammaproteobacteria bacterium]MBU1848143.1 enoyl-CoA hydratase/isomerase family protein [Gammaproteobacteria bacterium]